ncbi:hypothetical protein [Vulgatibacter sp.]|uniref:hypothetical protein n=1 Tax=Vulgatibacter sp. TaxID=1971226 RepID=UPI003561B893
MENAELKEQVVALKQEVDDLRFGADRLFAKANSALAEERYDVATDALQALLKRHPDAPSAVEAKAILAKLETAKAEREAAQAKRAAEEARRRELERKRATAAMKVERDEVREIAWYKDRSTRALGNQVHLYFGTQSDRVTPLRIVFQYYGDDWLFVKRVTIKADDQVFQLPFDGKRDHDGGMVWEWSDAALNDQSTKAVEAMLRAKKTIIRYEGDQYRKDFTLSSAQRKAMANVAMAHAALGGSAYPRLVELAGN